MSMLAVKISRKIWIAFDFNLLLWYVDKVRNDTVIYFAPGNPRRSD